MKTFPMKDAVTAFDRAKIGEQFSFDSHLMIKRITPGGLAMATSTDDKWRVLEQNPLTKSEWARLAQNGHRILWILQMVDDDGKPLPRGRYWGRIVDGIGTILHDERTAAKQPVTA